MTENYPEWFTPRLKYLRMKEEFQENFLKESTWGEFGSKEEVCALTSLLDYLKGTANFAEQFPQMLNSVTVDNKNLVIQRMIPLPDKLYEQILLAVVEGVQQQYESIWKQPVSVTLDKIEQYLIRRKRGSLLVHETGMCSEVYSHKKCTSENASEVPKVTNSDIKMKKKKRNMSKAATGLRKLRNLIYSGMKDNQNVQAILDKFYSKTENFIDNFGSELSIEDAETFRRRVRITRNAVKASLMKRLSDDQRPHDEMSDLDFDMEELADSSLNPDTNMEDFADSSLSPAEAAAREAACADCDAADNSFTSQNTGEPQEPHYLADKLVMTLPNVPGDSVSNPPEVENILVHDIDEQIQQRLTRLKFFTQAWSQNSPSFNSTTLSKDEADAARTIVETVSEIVPVESTEEDREEFNAWYYSQIDNPDKRHNDSASKYQSCSGTCSPLSNTFDLPNPMNIDTTTYMTSISDQQMMAMASTSHTSDPTMISPPSDIEKSEISKQQELLDVMTSLFHMQVNVVLMMVFTLSIILNNLNMELFKCAYVPDPSISSSDSAVLCAQPAEDSHLHELGHGHVQREQDQGAHGVQDQVAQEVQVQGLQGASRVLTGNGYVPPWKRIGISYTKFHSAQLL